TNAERIARNDNRAKVMMIEGLNQLAQEGLAQLRHEQIKQVIPEIVEEEPQIDWIAYIESIFTKQDIDLLFTEGFLAYYLTLDREVAAELRKRLHADLAFFNAHEFMTAVKAYKDKVEGQKEPSPTKEIASLDCGSTIVPFAFDMGLMQMCINSGLQENNEML